MADRGLDRRGHPQGDVAKGLFVVLVPQVMLVSGLSSDVDEPLALGPKVGLHGGVPLLPV